VRDETRCSVPLIKVQIVPFFVSYLLVAAGCSSNKPKGVTGATETAKTSPFPASDFEKQHQEAEKQFRPQIEAQRQQDQKEGEPTLDQEAIAAVEQTEDAIKPIATNNKNDGLASIERATGKINILLARNPTSVLIPVHVEVGVNRRCSRRYQVD
jgi:hypothetical protein